MAQAGSRARANAGPGGGGEIGAAGGKASVSGPATPDHTSCDPKRNGSLRLELRGWAGRADDGPGAGRCRVRWAEKRFFVFCFFLARPDLK